MLFWGKKSGDDDAVSRRRSLVQIVSKVVDYIDQLPDGFQPALDEEIAEVSAIEAEPFTAAEVELVWRKHLEAWPAEIIDAFIRLSFLVANEAILTAEDLQDRLNEDLRPQLMGSGALALAFKAPLAVPSALRDAYARDPQERAQLRFAERHFHPQYPYQNLIHTVLGPAAFEFFRMASRDSIPKVQPHEASREEWIHLLDLDRQATLESELAFFERIVPDRTKDMVGAAWALIALMSAMNPAVFLMEREPYISSYRMDGGLTISTGKRARDFLTFRPKAFVRVLRFVLDHLDDPVFTGPDVMWIAFALSEIAELQVGHTNRSAPPRPTYETFFSHRGTDTKTSLTKGLLNEGLERVAFLDCLAVPRSRINRLFLYESIVGSRTVTLVETRNFDQSNWCRRERSFAEFLNRWEGRQIQRTPTAEKALASLPADVASAGAPSRPSANGWRGPLWFYLSDVNRENGHRYPTRSALQNEISLWKVIDDALKVLQTGIESGALDPLTKPVDMLRGYWRDLSRGKLKPSDSERLDEICVVLHQHIFAILSFYSSCQEKIEVRKAVDSIAQVVLNVRALANAKQIAVSQQAEFLSVLSAAAAVAFDENRARFATATIDHIVPKRCRYREGAILVDVRDHSRAWLKFCVLLFKFGIGGIAVVQVAARPVHNQVIDGLSLEVMPCVTLYPGMERLLLR